MFCALSIILKTEIINVNVNVNVRVEFERLHSSMHEMCKCTNNQWENFVQTESDTTLSDGFSYFLNSISYIKQTSLALRIMLDASKRRLTLLLIFHIMTHK